MLALSGITARSERCCTARSERRCVDRELVGVAAALLHNGQPSAGRERLNVPPHRAFTQLGFGRYGLFGRVALPRLPVVMVGEIYEHGLARRISHPLRSRPGQRG